MLRQYALRLVFCLPLALGLTPAHSAAPLYTAVDLSDAVAGQDLWQYQYTISGSFVAFGGLEVQFDPMLYAQLQDPAPAVNADWSVVTTQPDAGLGTVGLYTATALNAAPSLINKFALSFVWLGSGTPGSQPYSVLDDTFSVLEQGQTAPLIVTAIPEPGNWALMAAGLLLLSFGRKCKWLTRQTRGIA